MSKGAKILVRFLVGLIVGIITASALGISVSSYLGYTAVTVIVAIVLALTVGLIVGAISGTKEYEGFVITAIYASSAAIAYNWGFSFYQYVAMAIIGACSTFILSLVLPTNGYDD